MMGKSTEAPGVIEFGPKRLEFVPYTAVNELAQVRTQYDTAGIEELARAIQSGVGANIHSSDAYELGNPLAMGRHTKQSAQRYIQDHGEFYGIARRDRTDYQDLTPFDDDTAVILIAGHRRRRAIGHLLAMNNIDPSNATVASNVRDEIEFGQAIGLQLRENVYERPSPQDEARAIDLSYRYNVEKLGQAPNIRQLAKQLGFSETKVRDALMFASLPASIQEYTASGALSYSVVRQLKPLYDAFHSTYREETPEDQARRAELSVREFCDTMLRQRLSGKTEEKIVETIRNRTKEIQGLAEYQQVSFDFLIEESRIERRVDVAGRQLASTALAVMRYRLRLGEINPAEMDELEALLAAHRAIRATNETPELPLGLSGEL